MRLRRGDAEKDPGDVLLPINDMTEARLVLTDALVAQALRQSKQNQRKETA